MELPRHDWTIRPGEVHVWQAAVPAGFAGFSRLGEQAGREACRAVMSGDERERGAQLKFPGGTELHELARGGLRRLLGLYTGTDPAALCFEYNGYGKPSLKPFEAGKKPLLEFNLSHSKGQVMWAFARRAVGVDLECHRPLDDLLPLAERYFAEPERRALRETPAEQRLERFYHFWTLKEAFIKGVGQGLSMPLDSFAIEGADELGPGRCRVATFDDPAVGNGWSLAVLSRKPVGFSAAVAVSDEGAGLTVVEGDWSLARWDD